MPRTRDIRSLLSEERGASFIVAMIVFLICAAAAGAVLMSASANAEHSQAEKLQEQAYLNLDSAAQLLVSDFNSYKAKLRIVDEGSGGKLVYDGVEVAGDSSHAYSVLITSMDDLVAQANSLSSGTTGDKALTVSTSANLLADVTGTMCMTSTYSVRIALSTTDDNGDAYTLSLTIPSAKQASGSSTTSYIFNAPVVSKGAAS